jgi:hypothetical protein
VVLTSVTARSLPGNAVIQYGEIGVHGQEVFLGRSTRNPSTAAPARAGALDRSRCGTMVGIRTGGKLAHCYILSGELNSLALHQVSNAVKQTFRITFRATERNHLAA